MSSEAEGRFHMVDVSSLTSRTPSGRTPAGPPRGVLRTGLRTEDGVRIEAVYEAATPSVTDTAVVPATDTATDTAIVVAHGFTGSVDRPALRRAVQVLRAHAPVVSFSFRGHGGSGGVSTVGDREVLDLAAAVRWARWLGHARVVTVGFSMGGSVVLRHAALERGTDARTDAVAAVSAPARWFYRGTPSMRRVHWVVTRPVGRLVGRYGLHTRIDTKAWDPVPMSPVEAVPLIAPTPLLVVHGDRDPYFPLDHPRSLMAAAGVSGVSGVSGARGEAGASGGSATSAASGGTAELWLEHGMGHAENAADEDLLDRLGAWLVRA
ncbi:alpha/beta fold hydrolase [Streptomyces sp. NPDC046203]|uniref:alpha/beta hydrolase n=1 Tax=Streptomyces sp. NPDC046203 TaxID=3154602 RepID=UPI0033CB6E96